MKKYKMIIIALGTALLLCSCQKDAPVASTVEMPEHITKELEKKLNIDADIIIPKKIESEIEVLEIELKDLDAKNIISKLYPNAVALYKDEDIYQDGKSMINISDGDYCYDNKNERIYSRFFTEQDELLFPTTTNLEKLDVGESLEKAKSYLSSIGLDNIALNKYYVLNKAFLEKQYNETKKEADWQKDVDAGREIVKEDWEDEKGAYIFNFEVLQSNIPIAQGAYLTKDNEYVGGSSIEICCSEKGIVSAHATGNYSVKALRGSKKLAGMDVITKGIEHKFSNLIIQEPITINQIRLVYQAQKIKGNLYLVPIWEVQYLQQCEGIMEKGTMYFDVETGKEIVIG